MTVTFRGSELINSPSLWHRDPQKPQAKYKTSYFSYPEIGMPLVEKKNNSLPWNSVKYEQATGDSHFLIKCQLKSIKKLEQSCTNEGNHIITSALSTVSSTNSI